MVEVALLGPGNERRGARGSWSRGRDRHSSRGSYRFVFFDEEALGSFGEVIEDGHDSRWLVTAT